MTPNERPSEAPATAEPAAAASPPPAFSPPAAPARIDHAAIERLVEGLLPALAARLRVGDLDEIEVREGGWRVRLRRPGAGAASSTSEPVEHPEQRGAASRAAPSSPAGRASPSGRTAGPVPRSSTSSLVGIGPAAGGPGAERATARSRPRRPVTSPAVGLFRPTPGFAVGRRVRSGDRIGVVDVLGVPHDVVAPTDGLVTEVVVEAGQPVEYGQELGSIEPLGPEAGGTSRSGAAATGTPASGTSAPGTPTPDTAGGS